MKTCLRKGGLVMVLNTEPCDLEDVEEGQEWLVWFSLGVRVHTTDILRILVLEWGYVPLGRLTFHSS